MALDLETNVRTSWALIFVHMTRYWFTTQYGAASQHAETIEDVLQLGTAQELVTRGVLAADLLESSCQDRLFDLSRHHDDPVDIAEDEVAGFHANAGADDRHVDVGHLAASLRVERGDAAMEDRETRVAEGAHPPRAPAAVVSNSPQGAMRSEPPQPKTTISPDLRSSMILISSS